MRRRPIDQLLALTAKVRHAEVYNLLGYSLRQLKRYEESARWYREALLYDPESRTALEYQGELFLAQGDAESARKNLRYLELLCGTDCREYGLLKQAFADAGVPITP
jgi:Flp pilus assembly protein TadD